MSALTAADSMFLINEHRNQPMHVGGLSLYSPPEGAGADFFPLLVEQMRQHQDALPPFNEMVTFRNGRWHRTPDDDFDLDYHFRVTALPRPGRIRELLELVSRLHGTLMDRNRPLWETYLIDGLADGRIAMYNKIHHAMADGEANMRIAASVLSLDANERKAPAWAQMHENMQNYGDSSSGIIAPAKEVISDLRAQIPGTIRGVMENFRGTVDSRAEARPFQAPSTIFNQRISGARRYAAQSYQLSRFKALKNKAGVTLNDITLAVCAGALRRYLMSQNALPNKPLTASCPVNIRQEGQHGGNQVAQVLANLGTHLSNPLDRLKLIAESMNIAKAKIQGMSQEAQLGYAAGLAAGMLPANITGLSGRRPMFNLVISNVVGPPVPLFMNGMKLEEMYSCSIPLDFGGLNITVNSYCDQFGFGFTACRRSVPKMQRLLDYTEQALEELEMLLGIEPPAPAAAEKPATAATAAKKKAAAKKAVAKKTAVKKAPAKKAAVKKAAVKKAPAKKAAAKKTAAKPASSKPAAASRKKAAPRK